MGENTNIVDESVETISVSELNGLYPNSTPSDIDPVLSQLNDVYDEKPLTEDPIDSDEVEGDDPPAKPTQDPPEEDLDEGESEDLDTSTEEEDEEKKKREDDDPSEDDEDDTYTLTDTELSEVMGLGEKGIQVDEEKGVTVRTKVDGKEAYVPLKELVESHQLESHLRTKSQEDAKKRKDFEEYQQTETQALKTQLTEATALTNWLESAFLSNYSSEAMEKLKQEDPSKWAVANQELQQFQQQMTGAKQQLSQWIQTNEKKALEQQEARRKAYLSQQVEALRTAKPAWLDREVANKEYAEMRTGIIDAYGFSEAEVGRLNDHRLILMALDALKGRAVDGANVTVKKALAKVPKIVKSGTSHKATTQTTKEKNRKTRRVKLKNTGSVDAAAAVLYDLFDT